MTNIQPLSRREVLSAATCGFGALALAGLCAEARGAAPLSRRPSGDSLDGASYRDPLAPKDPHHLPRAKRIIFLHMRGGPAHMDTFEYKPELNKRGDEAAKGKGRKLVASPWKWAQRGESGLWASDLLPHMAAHADDLCVAAGMHTDVSNHTPAMLQLHTGSFQFTRPSMGAWIMYGLGTDNRNLPGFISISPPLINGGTKNYGSAFLPAVYQGTAIGDIKTPVNKAEIGNLDNPRLSPGRQRAQLDLIQSLNRNMAARDPADTRLDGVIQSFELAFRMQARVPEVMDLSQETQATQEMYGIGKGKSDNFGRQCLLARRFAEAGVRYIELCDEFWDQHRNLKKGHEARAAATDQPIGALLTDLKQRGLLDDTLVLWGGEFGRTPDTRGKDGRDHNANGYSMVLAGGGVKGGMVYGGTDELGYKAVENRTHLHDMHATILHLMGLDHTQLTYRYAGRDFRLTDVHGNVAADILA